MKYFLFLTYHFSHFVNRLCMISEHFRNISSLSTHRIDSNFRYIFNFFPRAVYFCVLIASLYSITFSNFYLLIWLLSFAFLFSVNRLKSYSPLIVYLSSNNRSIYYIFIPKPTRIHVFQLYNFNSKRNLELEVKIRIDIRTL